jgi:hypothetical protein
MTKYTFTFDQENEGVFREVLSRLEPDEYSVVEDIRLIDDKEPRYSQKQAILEIGEEESCLTFRMRMGNSIKIRRERTEEELAEEKAINDMHTIRVNVHIGNGTGTGNTP